MGNFYTDVIQRDARFHSTDAIRDMNLLEPHFQAEVEAIIEEARHSGTELRVLETYRSEERQSQLFDDGKSQLRKVGVHHYGLACDFGVLSNKSIDWKADRYKIVGQLAEARNLTWGGRFSFRDYGHVQAVTVAEQPQLFNGTWYPSFGGNDIAQLVAPVEDVPPHGVLTSDQQRALDAIDRVNALYQNWFLRSTLMAFVQIESNFHPRAFRQEPNGVASYGLMQVLDATAASLGLKGSPEQMYDPDTSIYYGALYASKGWNILLKRFGRAPTYAEWADGYNNGYFAKNLGNGHYAQVWLPARTHWAPIVD